MQLSIIPIVAGVSGVRAYGPGHLHHLKVFLCVAEELRTSIGLERDPILKESGLRKEGLQGSSVVLVKSTGGGWKQAKLPS